MKTPFAALALTLAACSPAPNPMDAGSGGSGGGGVIAAGGGAGGGTSTIDAGDPTDAGSDAGTTGSLDAGEPCTAASDCGSGNCVAWFRDAGSVCGRPCFDETQCADLDGFTCIPDLNGAGVCVPKSPAHCLPCDFDVNCGGLSEVCVLAPGDTTMTCRVDCSLSGDDACPPGYSCTESRFNNQQRFFCTPPMGRCGAAPGGFCDRFSTPQPCANTNDAGVCVGNRTCTNGFFTACDALTAACRASCDDPVRPDCTEPLCPGATQLPTHCGACGNACPGAGSSTANVLCGADGGCSFSCRGQNYDVDSNRGNGCEVADSPTGNHTTGGATSLGSVPCNDGSTINGMGVIPSDTRVHENPTFTGFVAAQGAAPDHLSVATSGGTFCVNDIGLTLTVTQAANLACFRLTVTTDEGSWTCQTNAGGTCTITQGSGSYSGGTTTMLRVERTCSAAGTSGRYTVSGHF